MNEKLASYIISIIIRTKYSNGKKKTTNFELSLTLLKPRIQTVIEVYIYKQELRFCDGS